MLSRRQALRFCLAGSATLMLPGENLLQAQDRTDDPHFFLLIVLNGGADPSYMFDARPLEMTAAGQIQNYLGMAPDSLTGKNGGKTLASPLVKPLMKFTDSLSVLNGVMMAPSFDGHLQNMNVLFTGDPFGGGSFVPHLNKNGDHAGSDQPLLDAVIATEEPPVTLNNSERVVPLQAGAAGGLASHLRNVPQPAGWSPTGEFIRNRIAANAAGAGRLSQGARLMLSALDAAPAMHSRLAALPAVNDDMSPERQCLALISETFRLSISRSAVYMPPEFFDVHSAGLAKQQPQLFASAISQIAALLEGMRMTSFDRTRSILDVTTVMIASEFGRTMRAPDQPLDGTGTNHNSLTNSILIGGKGIRAGMVVGESDFAAPDEKLSLAHKISDPDLMKTMGRPFDFRTMQCRPDLPQEFRMQDYLTIGSVINTLYSLFGVPSSYYRKAEHDLPTAPVLHGLLT
jgi:uncharacterized protein (DUF1501 family)